MSESNRRHPIAGLSAYLDGELGEVERGEIAAHLASCKSCRAILDDLRAIAHASRGEATPAPPDGLAEGVRRSLDEVSAPRGLASRIARHTPLAAAASVLLVVAVALIVRGDLGALIGPFGQPAPETREHGALESAAERERLAESAEESFEARDRVDALEKDDAGASRPSPAVEPPRQEREHARRQPEETPGEGAAFTGASPGASGKVEAAEQEAARAPADVLGSVARDAGQRTEQPAAEESRVLLDEAADPAPGRDASRKAARESKSAAGAQIPVPQSADIDAEAAARGKQAGAASPSTREDIPAAIGARMCLVRGVLTAATSVSWTPLRDEEVEQLLLDVSRTGLGVTATSESDADARVLRFVVPVESWAAFRAWLAEWPSFRSGLPASPEKREPPGADCVTLRVEIAASDPNR